MSLTTRRSKKLSSDAPEDFEMYERELLSRLCKGQNKIIQDISSLRAKVHSNEAALVKLSKQFMTLNQSFEELKGKLHDARCKVDEIESSVQNHTTQIAQMYEHLLSLECYLCEYNLRFHNIPESPGEDCLQKINDILANQLNLELQIENAHQAGARSDDKPRVIICKFVYRPERYKVIHKKHGLKDGVWITEDLIGEDREKKKFRDVMKEAFERGKRPRFHRGNLYIDGTLYRET